MAGWIKISREIANHWLWQDAERLKWWLDLLFLAAWERKRQLVGNQLVILQKGQLIASLSFLCKRWGRSRTMVEPYLNLLIEEGMIEKEVSRNISIITILNYEKYQDQTHIGTYLNADLTLDISSGYTHPNAQNDAHLNAHPDADHDAHPDAIRKEYKEYNNISISSTSSGGESKNLKFIQELKNAQIWLEQMAMRFHIGIDEIRKRLDKFALDCDCRGTVHQDYGDTRRHFNDWLRIQLEAEKRNKKNDTDRQRQQDKRRGTQIDATSAGDYTTSF